MYVLSFLYLLAVVLSLTLVVIRPARRKRDPSHIPKPPNAFLCFRRAFNIRLQAENAEAARKQDGSAVKGQQKHVSVDASKVWNSMTAEEKAPYYKEAEEKKREYEERKREYERKYGKRSSAPREGRGGKGRKGRATVDPPAILDVPTASSSLYPDHGIPVSPLRLVVPSQGVFLTQIGLSHQDQGPSMLSTASYSSPVPLSIHPFNHESGWSSPLALSESLLPTPALTPCHTLSPSPGPSLYDFSPSANISRLPSPAELDFASDGAVYVDFPHAPMAPLTIPGDYLAVPGYQLYDSQPLFNGCAPLVPHHLGYVQYPAPVAQFNGPFPDHFANQMIPIPHSMPLGAELLDPAQAEYACQWSGELVDQAPLNPAVDLAVRGDVWQQVAPQGPACSETAPPQSPDWWIAHFQPSNEVIGSWDS